MTSSRSLHLAACTLICIVLAGCEGASGSSLSTPTTAEVTTTIAPTTTTTTSPPTTTTSPPTTTTSKEQAQIQAVAKSALLIAKLSTGDPQFASLRQAMANLLAGGKDYERVDSITGTANAEGPVLVIEATSRWSGTDNRQKAAIDAVALLAKASWDEKNFGATLADGTGAVGLQFISDGRTYNITGKQMKQVAEMTLSARAAMGL